MGSADFSTVSDFSKLRGPSFGSYNIRSIINKLDDIKVILGMSKLDFLGLTESWLTKKVDDAELQIPEYNMFRFDRDNGLGNRLGVAY